MSPALSKSRFVAGWQCPKLLWWKVHEPSAEELQVDIALRDLFDQGALVEERAREDWPTGVLIEGGHRDPARVAATRAAIDSGASAIFGATFEQPGVFCVVDVLERNGGDWTLIEVKSASSLKEYHIPDVAFQAYVARLAGVNVTRAEVMHLNKEYRHPGGAPLLVRTDVTRDIGTILLEIPGRIAEQAEVLRGLLPTQPIGSQCCTPRDCPFVDRCWPGDPDHIRHLWYVGLKTALSWMGKGVNTMTEMPSSEKLRDGQRRQLRAQREGKLIVEPGLREAMRPAMEARRLGFLDFETVGRAIPAWNGLGPWHNAAAQFSYHERNEAGRMHHSDFLAEGPANPADPPDDPREPLARKMLDVTANADRIVVYTKFEDNQIKALAEQLPHLAGPLDALRAKLWDLNPVVTDNVYHPGFHGSFSLKDILTPLVPDETYEDLINIRDGQTASAEIARLLFVSGRIPPAERDRIRSDLLAYCEKDTYATVRLVDRLIDLARSAG